MYSYYLRGQQQPLCMWMINETCKKTPHIWLLWMSRNLDNFVHHLYPKHVFPPMQLHPLKASLRTGNPSPSLLTLRSRMQSIKVQFLTNNVPNVLFSLGSGKWSLIILSVMLMKRKMLFPCLSWAGTILPKRKGKDPFLVHLSLQDWKLLSLK